MSEDFVRHNLSANTYERWNGETWIPATPTPGLGYQRGFADGYRAGVNESGAAPGVRTRGVQSLTSWTRATARELGMDFDENSNSSVLAVLHAIDRRLAEVPAPPAPVRVGDVVPGERARALGEGAVVIANDVRGMNALTRHDAEWFPYKPGTEFEYIVLRPPFDQDGASS